MSCVPYGCAGHGNSGSVGLLLPSVWRVSFRWPPPPLSFGMLQEDNQFMVSMGLHLGISIAAALLLYRLRFGRWFCLLLDNEPVPWRMALLLFALEATMEMFLQLAGGVRHRYLALYYLLVVMVILMAGLMQQAGAGELEGLCHTLSALDAGFDRRLGRKIQVSAQIGNHCKRAGADWAVCVAVFG